MTPDTLARIGELLYGRMWQTELARRLNVSDRTVRRWRAGDWPVPARVPAELQALVTQREDDMATARDLLKGAT